MLVPVIGLVQVGEQAMADRYMYLPLIGLSIILVWGAGDACEHWRLPKVACASAAGLVLLVCAGQTRHQIGYWRDSEALYHHDLAVTRKNWLACYNLGWYLDEQGRLDEALVYYRQGIEIEPRNPDPWNNAGVALAAKKQYAEALPYFQAALKADPSFFEAHNNIGKALEEMGKLDEAIPEYRLVLQHKPDHVGALNNLGNALLRKGQIAEAMQCYEASLRAKPDQATAHYGMAGALARIGAARSNLLGGFKLIGSLWSPAPWVKLSSGNTCPMAPAARAPFSTIACSIDFISNLLVPKTTRHRLYSKRRWPGEG